MPVFRVEKNKNYTTMSNYHFREKGMSLKAKGLLSLMLSLPDDWDYTIMGLVSICKENETAIKSTLDELKLFGYLEVVKTFPTQENGGRISYEYIIYESPKQEDKKQGVENLGVEIQEVENPGQLNTNKLNTNNKVVVEEYENEIGILTPYQAEKLFSYLDDLSEEMIIEAIHRASAMNKKSMAYIEGILKSWVQNGYKVLADIRDTRTKMVTSYHKQEEFSKSIDREVLNSLYEN